MLALASPFEEVVGPYLPVLVKGVLLPINGRIIYDGLLSTYRISFGPGIRRSLNADFKRAKETYGIITSLPEGSTPPVVKKKAPRKKASSQWWADGPKGCHEHHCRIDGCVLYGVPERGIRRPLPQVSCGSGPQTTVTAAAGQIGNLGLGIIRTIGWANFLHDPSQTPHLKLYAIDEAFGIAESTGAAKLKEIRTMFRIRQFDPKWTLPSKLEDNPMVWMVSVNGFIMDIRDAPRELQVQAFENGLIPYIPADRGSDSEDE